MDVEVKIIGREGIAANDRETVNVETHGKRGDTFVVMKNDQVLENDTVTFRVPDGGRLMLTMPEGGSEIVYDPVQGAAVRRDAQSNREGKADDPRTGEQRAAAELAGRRHDEAKRLADAQIASGQRPIGEQGGNVQANVGSGVRPVTQPQGNPTRPQMNAQQSTSRVTTPSETPEQKAKREAEEKAKAQQQSGAGRPAGEKPPAPGSTVGQPPSGNEGQK